MCSSLLPYCLQCNSITVSIRGRFSICTYPRRRCQKEDVLEILICLKDCARANEQHVFEAGTFCLALLLSVSICCLLDFQITQSEMPVPSYQHHAQNAAKTNLLSQLEAHLTVLEQPALSVTVAVGYLETLITTALDCGALSQHTCLSFSLVRCPDSPRSRDDCRDNQLQESFRRPAVGESSPHHSQIALHRRRART